MIRSMTGFGQASRHGEGYSVQVEIKTINHRYNEISLRLPREYAALEDSLKQEVRRHVKRGRTDAFISVERDSGNGASFRVDWLLAERYMTIAKEIGSRYGLESGMSVKDILSVPGLLVAAEAENLSQEVLEQDIALCLTEALQALVDMREVEGHHLRTDLIERLMSLRGNHALLLTLAPVAAEEYREKLGIRMREILGSVPADEQRLAMEAA
ncbi:MAG: stress-induced protein, partial [Gorillibacterium sp.]|nr:stress-induced protein [Gorillibacterium sp.]